MDVVSLLTSGDKYLILVLQAIAERARHYQEIRDHNLAVATADAVGEMLGLKHSG